MVLNAAFHEAFRCEVSTADAESTASSLTSISFIVCMGRFGESDLGTCML